MRFFIGFFAVIFAFYASAASAATLTQDQANSIKSSLQAFLDYQKEVNEIFGSVQVLYEGDLSAVPQDGYVAMTLPRITLKSKTADDRNIVDLGVISINAAPDIKAGFWKLSVTAPAAVTVHNAGEPDLQVNFGGQTIVGVFDQALGYFTKLDMTLQTITASEGGKDLGLKIAKGNLQFNLDQAEDGRLSGPASASIEGFSLGDDDSSFHMGKFGFEADIKRMKPLTLVEYKSRILKHKAAFESLAKPDTDKNQDHTKDIKNVTDMIFDLYDITMEGFGMRFLAENIGVDTYPSKEEPDAKAAAAKEHDQIEKFMIGSAFFGFDMGGLEADSGSLSMNSGYSGVSMNPMDPQYDGVLPTDVKFDVSAEKLPMKSLYGILKNTATNAASNPDMAAVAGIGLMIKLPAILAQAGSTLTVKDNFIQGGLYKAQIDGKLLTDLAAVASFTGKFTGLFTGLDALIAKIKEDQKREDAYTPEEYGDLASTLESIKSYGKAVSGATGSYSYDLELTPAGLVMINGKELDMSPPKDEGQPAPKVEKAPLPKEQTLQTP